MYLVDAERQWELACACIAGGIKKDLGAALAWAAREMAIVQGADGSTPRPLQAQPIGGSVVVAWPYSRERWEEVQLAVEVRLREKPFDFDPKCPTEVIVTGPERD